MKKFDAIIKMAEITKIKVYKNKNSDSSDIYSSHNAWHIVRNETLRRMRMYFNVSQFGKAPKKLYQLSNRIADTVVFNGDHFPLLISNSETNKKSALIDCGRQFKKLERHLLGMDV